MSGQFDIHWDKFQALLLLTLCLVIPGYTYLTIINPNHNFVNQSTTSSGIEMTFLFTNSIVYSIPILIMGSILFSYWWGNMRVLWKNEESYRLIGLSAFVGLIIFYSSFIVNRIITFFFRRVEYSVNYFYFLLFLTTIFGFFVLLILRKVRKRNFWGGVKN